MNRLLKCVLVLCLEVVILIPTCFHSRLDRGPKSNEDYWAETQLDSDELEGLLSSNSCGSSKVLFLACVNAISVMAERYNLALTAAGDFRGLLQEDVSLRVNEKTFLSSWEDRYKADKEISFLNAWKWLDKNAIRGPERSAVIAAGINGFLSIYMDPHSYIMPVSMYQEVVAASESRVVSVGFVARKAHGKLIIRKVFEGSPAEKAGLRRGDMITEINSRAVSQLLPSQINDLLKLKSIDMQTVNTDRLGLRIERDSLSKYVEIIRQEVQLPTVTSKVVEGDRRLGLVTVHRFSKNSCRQTKSLIVSLQEQGIRGLLLDLRDNPGGQVDEAACIINAFVKRGTLLFETRYLKSNKKPDKYFAEKEPIYHGPLAVLVNSGSASAAEIVAGSLKDLKRAQLVGEKTYGKGSFQDGVVWASHSKIALFQTEGLYYFPSGWTPQLSGILPDVEISSDNLNGNRESDLFYHPIVPEIELVADGQDIALRRFKEELKALSGIFCEPPLEPWKRAESFDVQMAKAQALLLCGERNGRNGTL